MKPFHLSTYISLAISLLVIISTVIVSTVLYFSLEKSLASEFEDRVKAESGELAQVMRNRLNTIDSRLTALRPCCR
jgi:type II secretory pathway component PulC